MRNVKKVIAGMLITAMSISIVGCGIVEKTEEGVNKTVVAKVYNTKITRGEVDAQLTPVIENVKAQYGENYAENEEAKQYLLEQRTSILDTMVNDVILNKKAEELKVMPSDAELNEKIQKELADIKASFDSDEQYKEALKQAGMTEEGLLKELKPAVISNAVYEESVKTAAVTDEEIKQDYDSNQTKYTEKPNKINPAHILVPTEEEAKAIIERLNNGEDFAALAKEKGTDGTKDIGGDLGWIDYNTTQYDRTFMLAAISVPKGEYTKMPIQTTFGYHVIKALDKEEYPVKKFEDVKEEIKASLLEQKKYQVWQDTMTKWQEEANIKVYEDKLK
ncbi:peptidylprolyl isomerase [Clostridium sp.]|uniref:peptidylprolyl isomerase n=1 Tax=Clostridium sp. TaxID=1506 RepID=UPI002FC5EDFF